MRYHALLLVAALLPVIVLSTANADVPNDTLTDLKWQFAYNEAGHITKIVDPAGRETKMFYDFDKTKRLVKRLTRELPDGTRVTYEFDRFGRRVSMTDGHGTVHYVYDGFNRLTRVNRDECPGILYAYDTLDRLVSVSLGKGLKVNYAYDFLGRVCAIETPTGKISYEYQTGQGMVIRTLPNGLRTIWEYYPDGTLKSISHVAKDNRILTQFSYSYRPDGLISQVREVTAQGQRMLGYEYDKVQRLVSVADSQGSKITFRYDKLGNQVEYLEHDQQPATSKYDWAGRMLQHNGHNCTHDAAGNLTSYVGESGKSTFEYNGQKYPIQKAG
jgi:YD repeat-containing protein